MYADSEGVNLLIRTYRHDYIVLIKKTALKANSTETILDHI